MLEISISRWWAIVRKEFTQIKRDRPTLAMIVMIPIIQLVLFGFAINTDPKHLPTGVVNGDQSVFTRSFLTALQNSTYFNFTKIMNEKEAATALTNGEAQFIITIPVDFTRKLLRGEKPTILLEADATDPGGIGGAADAFNGVLTTVIAEDFRGVLSSYNNTNQPYTLIIHPLYNPENITQYNIIPGLMGTILTFTLVMMTAIAITRERERGTMEQLLSMPVKPFEVVSGKIVPYIFIGLVQATIIVTCAKYLFDVPFVGSLIALYTVILLFISGTITIGITLSSFAKNQMQAIQFTMMILLPSILLSGFMFPFRGMPVWAQDIGQVLPLTYFVRLVRAIMLKGSSWSELWPNIWPLLIINIVVTTIGIKFYRKTLD